MENKKDEPVSQKSDQSSPLDSVKDDAAANEDDGASNGSGATWWAQNFPTNIDMVSLDNGTHAFFDDDTGDFVRDDGNTIYNILGFCPLPPPLASSNNDSSDIQVSSRSAEEGKEIATRNSSPDKLKRSKSN